MARYLILTAAALSCGVVVTRVDAQAIQAHRSLDVSQETLDSLVAARSKEVVARLALFDDLAGTINAFPAEATPDTTAARAFLPVIDRYRELARQVLAAADRPEEFFKLYGVLVEYDKTALTGLLRVNALRMRVQEVGILTAPPALFKVPDVVFVVGSTVTMGQGKVVGQAEISTNLLGAAAGTAFDAMGSTPLKEYFEDNLAVGTAFPFGGQHKLTAALGVGLGGLRLGGFAVWPAINIEQVDSGDARVPASVKAGSPTSANWSSPILSVAVSPWDLTKLAARVKAGKLSPVFTLGVILPYYYPNDPFSAVAALFSDKRGSFQKSGKVRFQVGVFFPLQKVKPVSTEKVTQDPPAK